MRRYIEHLERVTHGSLWHGTSVFNLTAIHTVDTLWALGQGISFFSDPALAEKAADDFTAQQVHFTYPIDFINVPAEVVKGALLEFDARKLRRAFDLKAVDGCDEEWSTQSPIIGIKDCIRAVHVDFEDIQWCMELVGDRQPYADDLVDLIKSPLVVARTLVGAF